MGGGAFGKQYAYSHNQAEHYLTKGYTEYIEVPYYLLLTTYYLLLTTYYLHGVH